MTNATARKRGRPSKLDNHRAFSCRIPLELYLPLRHYAVDRGISLNDLVIEALQQYWDRSPRRQTYAALLSSLLGESGK